LSPVSAAGHAGAGEVAGVDLNVALDGHVGDLLFGHAVSELTEVLPVERHLVHIVAAEDDALEGSPLLNGDPRGPRAIFCGPRPVLVAVARDGVLVEARVEM
jgi:hypothetical protein